MLILGACVAGISQTFGYRVTRRDVTGVLMAVIMWMFVTL